MAMYIPSNPRSVINDPKYPGSQIISENLLKSETLVIKYTKHQKVATEAYNNFKSLKHHIQLSYKIYIGDV